ncbi:MAG: L-histidine N(alpha)-methyltransferase [Thermoanaerobaculia bacterium]
MSASPAVEVASGTRGEFREDVRTGLSSTPKSLSPRYFYDELGSLLFDAICRLPWYPITRAESALIALHAAEVLSAFPDPLGIVELGPGNGEKLALFIEAGRGDERTLMVDLVDISASALDLASHRLSSLSGVTSTARCATFEQGLDSIAAARTGADPRLVLFLGSNLGNFEPPTDAAFLGRVRRSLRPGDGFLLGVDLVKEEGRLLLAYDDPLGVTAAFNKNLLVRINRELGSAFPLEAFTHRARWNAAECRVEMHLVATRALRVDIPESGISPSFEEGESIFTESSYKFELGRLAGQAESQGFRLERRFVDEEARYALILLRPK